MSASGWVQSDLPLEKKCPQCWNGMCKKHPLQDHGASLKFIDSGKKKEILASMFQDRIGSALKKISSEKERGDVDEGDFLRVGAPSFPSLVCGVSLPLLSGCPCLHCQCYSVPPYGNSTASLRHLSSFLPRCQECWKQMLWPAPVPAIWALFLCASLMLPSSIFWLSPRARAYVGLSWSFEAVFVIRIPSALSRAPRTCTARVFMPLCQCVLLRLLLVL